MGKTWAEAEMQTLDLGDRRRNKRVIQMLDQFAASPGASIPKACGSDADTKAVYRALSSDHVSAEEIRQAHARATVERMQGMKRVLILQDTTSLNFSTRPGIEGLGPMEKIGLRGCFVHSALALSPEGVPLGTVYQEMWSRDPEETGKRYKRRQLPIEEKESFRWLETVDACENTLPWGVEAWVIGDSEADIYELFAMPRRPKLHLVVRLTHDRRVESEEGLCLYAALERSIVLGEKTFVVPRSRKREARIAVLEVQVCTLKLEPPVNLRDRKDFSPVPVSVIRVREKGTTPAGEEPLDWIIATTVRVRTLEQAATIVEAYAHRWKVERYHYVLKSGCRVEDLQLESADRIERALALYNVVAWRLLYMTYLARVEPDLPCTAVLEEEEWQALIVVGARKPLPKVMPTLREVVRMIAALGGFLGRKGDGEPGVQSLWTGLRRLLDYTHALRCIRLSPSIVGNG